MGGRDRKREKKRKEESERKKKRYQRNEGTDSVETIQGVCLSLQALCAHMKPKWESSE